MNRETAEIVFNGIEYNAAYEAAVKSGICQALRYENAGGEICAELTCDTVIHEYNRIYRGVDRPTDVLSFPVREGEALLCTPDNHMGDIMISVDTANRQAKELGHSVERELLFLAIHGALHILGYDHIEPDDEAIMLKKQRVIIDMTEVVL